MKTRKVNQSTNIGLPQISFADVLGEVEAAPGLTLGVRGNMRSAVIRCSGLVGHQGLHAGVDLQLIAERLEKLTPAKLGFTNPNSLAAFQSNLRRALKVAGITVMPGRHQEPLAAAWSALAASARSHDAFLWPAMSRFVSYLSGKSIDPELVNEHVFAQFGADLRNTCLGSKVDKVVRNTASAWQRAQSAVPGWPAGSLGYKPRRSDVALLSWAAFPSTLEQDARQFLQRDNDWLSMDDVLADSQKRPLRPATIFNYLEGLRRCASILVTHGTSASDIGSLAYLVRVDQVRTILKHVSERTDRKQGGHVMFLALLLFIVARDHVGMKGQELAKLEAFFKKTRPTSIGMSDRTLERYTQFEDAKVLDRLIRLPRQLMAEADKSPKPDISAAKLARMALYLALLSETCARSGNVVGLSLDKHIVSCGTGKSRRTFVVIPANEVKNGEEIRAQLSRGTAGMLSHYVARYRPVHCAGPCAWLFARLNGTYWPTTQACTDVKDIVGRYLGVDLTPHLMRSLAGKIILDAHPGAIATVQQLLGHKRIDTTLRFYARLDPQKARAEYQNILAARGQ